MNRLVLIILLFLGFSVTTFAVNPSVQIKANTSSGTITIPYGSSVKLSWTSTGVSSCTGTQSPSGYWGGTLSTNGTQTTSSLYDAVTFTITCKVSSTTNVTDKIVVYVQPQTGDASVTLLANQEEGNTTISYGASTTLTWSSANTIFCTQPYSATSTDPSRPITFRTDGQTQIKSLTEAKTFFINCESPSGNIVTSSVVIDVGDIPLPEITLTANQDEGTTSILYGTSTIIIWSSTNTDNTSCRLFPPTSMSTSTAINRDIVTVATSGQKVLYNLVSSGILTLSCKNQFGVATSSVFIDVSPKEVIDGTTTIAQSVAVTDTKCSTLDVDLRYGSDDSKTSGQVSLLQDFLRTEGLYKNPSTGHLGKGTVFAIRHFQKKNGIPLTGFVGSLTRSKLNSIHCKSL